jgi:predicted nucleic acid-binding protein
VNDRSGYLLDTNVLSETRRKKADSGVLTFLESVEPSSLYLSVLTIGEFRKGVIAKKREDPDAAARLSNWIDGLELSFADRIVGVDVAIAKLWGEWSGERPRSVVDTLLASTAVVHEFTLVTRNVRDIADLPVKTLNPWEESGG